MQLEYCIPAPLFQGTVQTKSASKRGAFGISTRPDTGGLDLGEHCLGSNVFHNHRKHPSLTDIELCTSTGSNAAYCGHVAVVRELALPAKSGHTGVRSKEDVKLGNVQ